MDPPLKKKYRTVKVKKFINSWLDEYIDGVKTSTWLRPDPEHIDRALCLVCLAPCSFSINGGFKYTAVWSMRSSKEDSGRINDYLG